MTDRYHTGELEVQERAGVRLMASRIGNSIHDEVPERAAEFLHGRHFLILGAEAGDRGVWATMLRGAPGFAHSPTPDRVSIHTTPTAPDPLAGHLKPGTRVGLLAIDPATRRRMRVNGVLTPSPPGTLEVATEEVYSNCPKYITRRTPGPAPQTIPPGPVRRGTLLPDDLAQYIRGADTFFLASTHRDRGADVSHRGGPPGFVQIGPSGRLLFPDYKGNAMFNTLGNLAADPRAGLLFWDDRSGLLLQLTGQAEVVWDPARIARVEGAERLVEVAVDRWIARERAGPSGWERVSLDAD